MPFFTTRVDAPRTRQQQEQNAQYQRQLNQPPPGPAQSGAPGGLSHARLNHMQIREQEAINRERRAQDEFEAERKAAQAKNLRAKYEHVRSNYNAGAIASGQPVTDDVEIKVFVRECDPDAYRFSIREKSFQQERQQQQPPPAVAQPTQLPVIGRQGSGRAAPGALTGASAALAHKSGEVPRYLQERKAEQQAEKDEIQRQLELRTEQAKYPPGHRPLGEDERQTILAKLAQRKKELEFDLGRFPVRIDTQSAMNRRRQLENELNEIDAAERKFMVNKQLFVPV